MCHSLYHVTTDLQRKVDELNNFFLINQLIGVVISPVKTQTSLTVYALSGFSTVFGHLRQ